MFDFPNGELDSFSVPYQFLLWLKTNDLSGSVCGSNGLEKSFFLLIFIYL